MNPSQILGRLTGIGTPIFGVSWNPPISDRDLARRVIVFLEDRRVLYDPTHVESAAHCIASVVEIRRFLTDVLGQGGVSTELEEHLRAIRKACRRFFQTLEITDRQAEVWLPDRRGYSSGFKDWRMNQALGEMRARVGIHIAQIAVMHGLDVEDRLAEILPPDVEEA